MMDRETVLILTKLKLKCLDKGEADDWFASFEPSEGDVYSIIGTIRAFCGDCEEHHREDMKKEGRCLW